MKREPRGSSISAHTTRSTCSTASDLFGTAGEKLGGGEAFHVGAAVGQGRSPWAGSARAGT